MCDCNRRTIIATVGGAAAWLLSVRLTRAESKAHARFIAEAERMKQAAIASGDQPYGAIIVRAGEIVGRGPSRVVVDRNPEAHAERIALWDAQRRTGNRRLDATVIYSTSRPCPRCQQALAGAGVARMHVGPDAGDAGPPRGD